MHQILIKLEGEHFDGAISGDFAKGLVAIQENFYRYCAYVLYGKDDIKLLGKEKAKYTLYFSINRGCTETIAKISQSIEKFIDRALKKNDSTTSDWCVYSFGCCFYDL